MVLVYKGVSLPWSSKMPKVTPWSMPSSTVLIWAMDAASVLLIQSRTDSDHTDPGQQLRKSNELGAQQVNTQEGRNTGHVLFCGPFPAPPAGNAAFNHGLRSYPSNIKCHWTKPFPGTCCLRNKWMGPDSSSQKGHFSFFFV